MSRIFVRPLNLGKPAAMIPVAFSLESIHHVVSTKYYGRLTDYTGESAGIWPETKQ